MAELKTKKTTLKPSAYLAAIDDAQRRKDCRAVMKLMQDITGEKPSMWGTSIVGFGSYTYTYASGHSGEWPVTGFSSRKGALTLYVMTGFAGEDALLQKLGTFKTGKSCLYVKRLADVDVKVLKALVTKSVAAMKKRYPAKRA